MKRPSKETVFGMLLGSLAAIMLSLPLVSGDAIDGVSIGGSGGTGTDGQDGDTVTAIYAGLEVEGNATTTTFVGASSDFSNKAQLTIFDTNLSENDADGDHTSDDITIATTGYYDIELSVSFSGGISDTYSLGFFKNNGATQVGSRMTRKIGTGGDTGAGPHVTGADLTAGDTLEVWIQNEDDTSACTIEDATFKLSAVDIVVGGGGSNLVITAGSNVTIATNGLERTISSSGGGGGWTRAGTGMDMTTHQTGSTDDWGDVKGLVDTASIHAAWRGIRSSETTLQDGLLIATHSIPTNATDLSSVNITWVAANTNSSTNKVTWTVYGNQSYTGRVVMATAADETVTSTNVPEVYSFSSFSNFTDVTSISLEGELSTKNTNFIGVVSYEINGE